MSMKAAGIQKSGRRTKLVSLAVILVAAVVGLYVAHRNAVFPSTDDAEIDADVVQVASVVGGRVISIPVQENAHVSKGDVLFQIDPVPYQFAVAQTQADVDLAKAQLATQQRAVTLQRAAADIAAKQVTSATANYELATRTVERLTPLAAKGYVPVQQLDQAQVAQHDAATALAQAQVQQQATLQAIDTLAATEATVSARQAALAIAQRALSDTTVRATHDGFVTGLTVSSGEMVAPAQILFTLINTDEWFAVANFRETSLRHIAVGDCATVYSMIDRSQPIKGVVQGIGWGVFSTERVETPLGAPYVERSLNWVRVAERFPVRIVLQNPPQNLTRLGASSVVEINRGAECH